MCKPTYKVVVTGDVSDREKIAGKLVMNSGNLVTGFSNGKESIVFFFRYKSDAKLVMRNVTKMLLPRTKQGGERFVLGNAVATISKIN